MKKYTFPKNQKSFFTHNHYFDYPELHTHSYWEIHIFLSGTATHFFNGHRYQIEPNTIWVIHPADKHCIIDGSPDLSYINFGIDIETFELFTSTQSDILKTALQQPLLCFPISQKAAQIILANEIELLQLDKNSLEFTFALYKQFLNIMLRIINRISLPQLNNSIPLDEDISILANKLKDKNNMNRSLTDILSEFPYSYGGIAKKFKQQLKISPSEFFIQRKMEFAKNLLESTRNSIESIADIVGYASNTCFYNTFKSYYGVSPGAYRKQWLNDYNKYEEV
jgi:AraC-like DNA-binding protein